MLGADIAHTRHEAFMRRDHSASAKDRLHDKGRNGARPLKGDFIFQGLQAKLRQPFGVAFVKRIAIGVGGRNMVAAGQQRFILGSEISIAVDRGAAHMGAVIALFQAEELGSARFAAHLVVLPGQAQGGFHRIRTARGEKGTAEPVGGKEIAQHLGQLDHLIITGAAKSGIIGQHVQLSGNGVFDGLAGEPEIDVPKTANRINHLMTIQILDPHARGSGDNGRRVGLAVGRMCHGVPKRFGVMFL